MDFILSLFEFIINRITSITFFDILDIAIVSVVFYYIFKFVRDRRAGHFSHHTVASYQRCMQHVCTQFLA